jgi:hypothetical protein
MEARAKGRVAKHIRYLLLSLVIFSGCMRSAVMTHDGFNDIQLGTPISSVEKTSGRPYSIHVKGPGREEYEYIERIDVGAGLYYENHYYLMVVDDVVTAKRTIRDRPPSYDFLYSDDPNVFNNY